MLGFKNVFPVFVAIAYVALECKVLQNTSCIRRQLPSRPMIVGVLRAH